MTRSEWVREFYNKFEDESHKAAWLAEYHRIPAPYEGHTSDPGSEED